MTPDGRQTVLFVEDEPLLREAVAVNLEDEGFDVLQAGSGEEALALIRARGEGIDWLFTDLLLPGALDGWHVAFEFRFVHPLRPVVYATGGHGQMPPAVAGSVFLRKPYSVSEVLAALGDLAQRSGIGPSPSTPP